MTSTAHPSISLGSGPGRPWAEGVAERLGLALLSWADHRQAVGRRRIDLARVPRDVPFTRPFC